VRALQHGTDGQPDRQVLVVGTGIAGLLTAVACRERGFDPVVTAGADPDRNPVLTLWRPTGSLLDGLDLGDTLAAGTPVRRWVCRHPRRRTPETLVHDGEPEAAPCVRVRRSRVERALAATVPNSRLWRRRTIRRVERCRSGSVVTFEDGVRERFDLVVGADGPDSRVRDAVVDGAADGVDPVVPTPVVGVSERPARLEARHTVYEHWSPAGSVTRLSHLDGGDVWRYVASGRNGGVVGTERWTGDGLALVGEAAHPLSPVLTTQDSLAVEDGTTLAAVLASRPTTRAALQTYERRRSHRTRRLYGGVREDTGASADTAPPCRQAFLRTRFGRRDSTGRPDDG
jgi:2-polyprenyl-6-methoxyphenol hydroxylase-like FAD-dependent oxidoreductase